MSRPLRGAALIAALALAVTVPWLAAAGAGDTAFTDAERAAVRALAVPPGHTPPEVPDPALAEFGQRLFFDRRLSGDCLLYTSPSPRDKRQSRMPSSA